MRDQTRDNESAIAYAEWSDADLIVTARAMNRRLIAMVAELAAIWDDAEHLRAQQVARELQTIRYELARRRIPNPSGAQASVTVTGSSVVGTNAGSIENTSAGDVDGSSGLAVGRGARVGE